MKSGKLLGLGTAVMMLLPVAKKVGAEEASRFTETIGARVEATLERQPAVDTVISAVKKEPPKAKIAEETTENGISDAELLGGSSSATKTHSEAVSQPEESAQKSLGSMFENATNAMNKKGSKEGGIFDGLRNGLKSFFDGIGSFFGDIGEFFTKTKNLIYHPAQAVAADTKGVNQLTKGVIEELADISGDANTQENIAKITRNLSIIAAKDINENPSAYIQTLAAAGNLSVKSLDSAQGKEVFNNLFKVLSTPENEEHIQKFMNKILTSEQNQSIVEQVKCSNGASSLVISLEEDGVKLSTRPGPPKNSTKGNEVGAALIQPSLKGIPIEMRGVSLGSATGKAFKSFLPF